MSSSVSFNNSKMIHKATSFSSLNSDTSISTNTSSSTPKSNKKLSINDFDIIKELGRGAYGKVVLARNKATNREYAIKIIDKFFLDKLNKTKEAFVEREMLSSLSHDNISKLVSSFQSKEKLFFILKYFKNGTLNSLIKKAGFFPKELAQFYLAQIVSVLEYFECKNIAHRDLKSDNILIDDNYNLQLIDFATATIIGKEYNLKKKCFIPIEDNKKDELVGTAEYASPEMLNHNIVNPKSCDLWSLGCIMFQMFHGYTPFKGYCEKETIENVNKGLFYIRESLDDNTKDLIERLLIKNQNERIGMKSINEIKSHPFFNGINFDDLHFENTSIQISKVFKSKSESFLTGNLLLHDTKMIIEELEDNHLNSIEFIDNYYNDTEEDNKDVLYEGIVSYEKKLLFFNKKTQVNIKLYSTKILISEVNKSTIKTIDLSAINEEIHTEINKNKLSFILSDNNREYKFTSSLREGEKWVNIIRRTILDSSYIYK